MMNSKNYRNHNLYKWRVEFLSGFALEEDEFYQMNRAKRMKNDPQRLNHPRGQAIRVVLVPQRPDFPEIAEDVPFGCAPVCCSARSDRGGVRVGNWWRIGFNRNGVRHFTLVNMADGSIQRGLRDNGGRKIRLAD